MIMIVLLCITLLFCVLLIFRMGSQHYLKYFSLLVFFTSTILSLQSDHWRNLLTIVQIISMLSYFYAVAVQKESEN